MSDRIVHIHFAVSMSLLLKPKGKQKTTVFQRLMDDWNSVRSEEWTVRPPEKWMNGGLMLLLLDDAAVTVSTMMMMMIGLKILDFELLCV